MYKQVLPFVQLIRRLGETVSRSGSTLNTSDTVSHFPSNFQYTIKNKILVLLIIMDILTGFCYIPQTQKSMHIKIEIIHIHKYFS